MLLNLHSIPLSLPSLFLNPLPGTHGGWVMALGPSENWIEVERGIGQKAR
jgi:hypothetical protein